MTATSVGTPTPVRATSSPVTGTWGTGQSRTAGHLLVAVVTASASTSISGITQNSGTTGWGCVLDVPNGSPSASGPTVVQARTSLWTKVAAGTDAAPAFACTISGTGAMTCTLFEFSSTNNTVQLQAIGQYMSGIASSTVTTTVGCGSAPSTSDYVIAVKCMERATGTNTYTVGGTGFSNLYSDGSTSSYSHTAIDVNSTPSGTPSDTGSWATKTTAYAAGICVGIADASVANGAGIDSIGPTGIAASSSASTTLSWTHNCSNNISNGAMVLGVNVDTGSDGSLTCTATCDGASMASQGREETSGATTGFAQMFYLASGITSGGHSIVVTVAGGTPTDITGVSIAINNANGHGTPVLANTASTHTVVFPSTTAGGICVGMGAEGNLITSPTAPAVYGAMNNLQGNGANSTGNIILLSTPSTGSGLTLTWAGTGTSSARIGVEILPNTSTPASITTTVFNGSVSFPSAAVKVNASITTAALSTSVGFNAPTVAISAPITTATLSGTVSFPAETVLAKTAITTSVFSGTVSFPAPTITTLSPNANIIPTTFAGTVSFPSATIAVNAPITPTSFSGSVAFPAPSVAVNAAITTTALLGTVAFPAPTILAQTAFTTTTFSGSVSFPGPTVSVNAAIVPTTFSGSVSFPAPTIGAGGGSAAISLTTFTTTVSFTSPTIVATTNIVPSVLNTSVAFSAPTITAITSITTTALLGNVTFPSTTILANTAISPSVFSGSVAFPSSTVLAVTNIVPTAFAGTVSFPALTTSVKANITTSVFSGSVAFPAITTTVSAPITTTVFSGTVAFPSTTETVSASITTSVFSGTVAFPAPTIGTGSGGAAISPTTFVGSVAFSANTVLANTVITPSVFSGSITFSGPSIAVNAPIAPSVFSTNATFFTPTISVSAAITTSVLNGTVAFPAPATAVSAVITTALFSGSVAFIAPTVNVNVGIVPSTLYGSVVFPAPIISAGSMTNAFITTVAFIGSVIFPALTVRSMIPIPDSGIGGTASSQPIGGIVGTPNIGGTASANLVGGTAIAAKPISGTANGTLVEGIATTKLLVGGTAANSVSVEMGTAGMPNALIGGNAIPKTTAQGSVANQANYGGSETSKIMAIMINLSGYENNDSTFYLQALNNGYPLPLTGYTNKLVVKLSPSVADNTGTTYTVGSGLTLTNSSQGMITFVLPHTAAQTAGTSWWRWDIIDGGLNVTTVMFGNLYILPV